MIHKIEKNIPVPEAVTETQKWKTLAKAMVPGDSVFVKTEADRVNLRTALVRTGKRVVSRKVTGGFRVWHIAERK